MEFITFTSMMKETIEKRIGGDCQVKVNEIVKNNGILLTGITVTLADTNISPMIYLDEYYGAYIAGTMSVEQIIEDILKTYEQNRINKSIDIHFFTDFSQVKDNIIYKVINREMNEALLRDIPYIPCQDLAIVFQCLVAKEEGGNATIMIHHVHVTLWNTTIDEIYACAKQNTPRLYPYEIRDMKDMVVEMMKQNATQKKEIEQVMEMPDYAPMYVLTNTSKMQGAASLFYPDILKDFAKTVQKNLFILPSSIHEVLLLTEEGDENIAYLKQMVKEVNETQVEPEEVLSNQIYYYHRETNQLSML